MAHLVESIDLPHCWVCSERFTDSAPPGKAQKEVHHIVPQAYGGRNGPTVTLCSDHHSTLHQMAKALEAGKSVQHFLSDHNQQERQKLYYLAEVVYNAKVMADGDPNKNILVTVSLNGKERKMLEALRKVHPSVRSQQALIKLALARLYAQHFIGS